MAEFNNWLVGRELFSILDFEFTHLVLARCEARERFKAGRVRNFEIPQVFQSFQPGERRNTGLRQGQPLQTRYVGEVTEVL